MALKQLLTYAVAATFISSLVPYEAFAAPKGRSASVSRSSGARSVSRNVNRSTTRSVSRNVSKSTGGSFKKSGGGNVTSFKKSGGHVAKGTGQHSKGTGQHTTSQTIPGGLKNKGINPKVGVPGNIGKGPVTNIGKGPLGKGPLTNIGKGPLGKGPLTNIGKGPLGKGPLTNVGKGPLGKGPLTNVGKGPLGKHSPFVKKGVISNQAHLRGRVGVPNNLRPRHTILKPIPMKFHARFKPFLQREWKSIFFWTFVAGLGYVTVPQLIYDRFVYLSNNDDYDGCVNLLSNYAVQEEPTYERVAPANVTYRYSAPAAPPPVALQACSYNPFIERKWGRQYVWVQIPDVGNVTVPEDHYDQFLGFISANPPDYPGGCRLLTEAAANDTVVSEGPAEDNVGAQ